MRFVKKNRPNNYDIPLLRLNIKEVHSNDVLQVIDCSNKISGNNISQLMMTLLPDTTGKLSSSSRYSDIKITDEYLYDYESGKYYYLFFVAYPESLYYNGSSYSKQLTISTDNKSYSSSDRIIKGLKPLDKNTLIIYNSFKVHRKYLGSAETELSRSDYDVDYGEGTLYLNESVTTEDNGKFPEFKISYSLLTSDIQILSTSEYRIEIEQSPVQNQYMIRVLLENNSQVQISYKEVSNNNISLKTEFLNCTKLFHEISNEVYASLTNILTINRRSYNIRESSSGYDIYVINSFKDHKYFIKSDSDLDTIITIKKPVYRNFKENWFCSCTTGKIFSSDNKKYTVQKSDIKFKYYTDKSFYINSKRISLRNGNIITYKQYNDIWKDIVVFKASGEEIFIDYVNTKEGIIDLKQSVAATEDIYVTYKVQDNSIDITKMCFNPIIKEYKCDINIRNYYMFFLIIDDQTVTTYNLTTNIFIGYVPRYSEGNQLLYSYQDIYNYINYENTESGLGRNIRMTNRASIIDFGNTYIENTKDVKFEILAIMYLISPIDQDGFNLEDVRILGGGMKIPDFSCYDYSLYDGEISDLSAFIDIIVTKEVYNTLIERYKTWSEEVILSDNPDIRAKEIVDDLLTKLMNKYVLLGSEGKVIIE